MTDVERTHLGQQYRCWTRGEGEIAIFSFGSSWLDFLSARDLVVFPDDRPGLKPFPLVGLLAVEDGKARTGILLHVEETAYGTLAELEEQKLVTPRRLGCTDLDEWRWRFKLVNDIELTDETPLVAVSVYLERVVVFEVEPDLTLVVKKEVDAGALLSAIRKSFLQETSGRAWAIVNDEDATVMKVHYQGLEEIVEIENEESD